MNHYEFHNTRATGSPLPREKCVCSVWLGERHVNATRRNFVLAGVDGTGPPTGGRPRRCTAAGRVAACEERRIGDCKIGAGQGLPAGTRAAAEWSKEKPRPVLHSGIVPQRDGIPVNMREALGGPGILVAVEMGDVRRPSPRPRCPGGGHSAGLAGKKQSRCRTEQARSAWREEV